MCEVQLAETYRETFVRPIVSRHPHLVHETDLHPPATQPQEESLAVLISLKVLNTVCAADYPK